MQMQVLSGKTVKYNKAPKIAAQELENLTTGIKFMNDEGLKYVNARLIDRILSNSDPT